MNGRLEHVPHVVKVNLALIDGDDSHPQFAKREAKPVPCHRVEPAEAVLIPAEHQIEIELLGILDESGEIFSIGTVAADSLVFIVANDLVAVTLRELLDLFELTGD